jgi:hypothetical protein
MIKTCDVCGEDFETKIKTRKRCSKECDAHFNNQRNREYRKRPEIKEAVRQYRERPENKERAKIKAKLRRGVGKSRKIYIRKCKYCKDLFVGKTIKNVFCRKACSERASYNYKPVCELNAFDAYMIRLKDRIKYQKPSEKERRARYKADKRMLAKDTKLNQMMKGIVQNG